MIARIVEITKTTCRNCKGKENEEGTATDGTADGMQNFGNCTGPFALAFDDERAEKTVGQAIMTWGSRFAPLPVTDESYEATLIVHETFVNQEILTTRCPGCEQPFYEFEGCFALRCGTCDTAFCGYCLMGARSDWSGNTDRSGRPVKDAHAHVRACTYNTAIPMSGRRGKPYYNDIEEHHKAMRTIKKKKMLMHMNRIDCQRLRKDLLSPYADRERSVPPIRVGYSGYKL